MNTKILAGAVVMAMTVFGAGCSGGATGTGDGTGNGTSNGTGTGTGTDTGTGAGAGTGTGGTIDANTRYVPEADATKATAIQARMWNTLLSHGCWYLQGSTINYSFSGTDGYRYAGAVDTYSGHIGLNSVGSFGGYDAAEVVISDTTEWIGIADANTIVFSSLHDGTFIFNTYVASDGACV